MDTDDAFPLEDRRRSAVLAVPTVRTAGIPLVAMPAAKMIEMIKHVAGHLQKGIAVHFVNAYTVSLTTDDQYLRLFEAESVNFADGTPLAWFARRQVADVAHLRGPDAFRQLLDSEVEHGLRHFLLGGSPDSLRGLRKAIAASHPSARVVGSFSPPFTPLELSDENEIDSAIRASGANVVWVGIGTPKQDFEVARLADVHPAVVLAVGAAFNFVSGDVPEAPTFWRRSGLEWMYRLGREPRRLWRRYAVGNLRFLTLTIGRWND